tara:strand:- start:69 stop:647 length:579 start_codon:yes stop_codon:yes gene_type:complete
MKKKIIKPKLYKLDLDSIDKNSTGFLFFKHHFPRVKNINESKFVCALSMIYYTDTFNYQNCIQIVDKKITVESSKKYITDNYNLQEADFTLVRIIDSDKLTLYLVLLNDIKNRLVETLSKKTFKSESILEMIDKQRLTATNDYWGLLSTAFCKSRNNYLEKCLYPVDSDIKLELKIKKVYKALIGYNTIKGV